MSDEQIRRLPVTQEAADLLRDRERARAVGRLVSDILRPGSLEMDPLAALIAEVRLDRR